MQVFSVKVALAMRSSVWGSGLHSIYRMLKPPPNWTTLDPNRTTVRVGVSIELSHINAIRIRLIKIEKGAIQKKKGVSLLVGQFLSISFTIYVLCVDCF